MSWLTASKTYVCIKLRDWIDVGVMLMKTGDLDLVDFYISQLPEDAKINSSLIDEFKEMVIPDNPEFKLKAFDMTMDQLDNFVEALKENDRWKR